MGEVKRPWVIVWFAAMFYLSTTVASRSAEPASPPAAIGDDAVRHALDRRITVRFIETPLDDAAEFLGDTCGLNVLLDRRALQEAGVAPDAPLTFAAENVSLRSALDVFRRAYRLDWAIRDDTLLITTREQARLIVCQKAYAIDDLIGPPEESAEAWEQARQLREIIVACNGMGTWYHDDVPSAVSVVPAGHRMRLFVTHNRHVHRQVERLLARLRGAVRPTTVDGPSGAPPCLAVETALSHPVSVDFRNTLPADALRSLQEQCGVRIVLDEHAFFHAPIARRWPTTLRMTDVPLRIALERMLERPGLTYVVDDEALWITSPHEVQTNLFQPVDDPFELRVYPISDLLDGPEDSAEESPEFRTLRKAIRSESPLSWEDVGGKGRSWPIRLGEVDTLAVLQTWHAHEAIVEMLDGLRTIRVDAAAGKLEDHYAGTPRPDQTLPGAAIAEALKRPVALDVGGFTLQEVAQSLGDISGVPVHLDTKALDKVVYRYDAPISATLNGVSLRSALRLLLRRLDLTYFVDDGAIWITTPEDVPSRLSGPMNYGLGLSARWYPVGDLIARTDAAGQTTYDIDALIDILTSAVDPLTWEEVGGAGSIRGVEYENLQLLLISQTSDVHDQIAWCLSEFRASIRDAAAGTLRPVYGRPIQDPLRPGEAAVFAALDRRITLDFVERPLDELVEVLCKETGVNVQLDSRALDEVGIDSQMPITFSIKNVSLRSALRLMLRVQDLTVIVQDEVLLITTPEEGEQYLSDRFYPVGDLIAQTDSSGATTYDFESLMELIVDVVAPTSWDGVGGAGSIREAQFGDVPLAIVSQSLNVQEEVAELLAGLRKLAREHAADGRPADTSPVELNTRHARAKHAVRDALDQQIDIDFRRKPLTDAAAALGEQTGINVLIDRRALTQVGIDSGMEITLVLEQTTLRAALDFMLRQEDLAHVFQDEVLLITTPEEAECHLTTVLYPVGDLKAKEVPVSPGQTFDPFQPIIDIICSSARPLSWVGYRGAGSIRLVTFAGLETLAISQTADVHEEIAELLSVVRQATADVAAGSPATHYPRPTPREESIRQALQQAVSLDHEQAPLRQIVGALAETHNVPILFDRRAMVEVDISADVPVSIHVKEVSLESVLRLMLWQTDLTFVNHVGVVLITTPEEALDADVHLHTRVYHFDDLPFARDDDGNAVYDPESLFNVIGRSCGHPSCLGGGPGRIGELPLPQTKLLVVTDTADVHDHVVSVMARLRRCAADTAAGRSTEEYRDRTPAAETIQDALRRKVTLDIRPTPLRQAVRTVAEQCNVNVALDWGAFRWHQVEATLEKPVSSTVNDVPLSEALNAMLRPANLKFIVRHDVLLITTPEEAEAAVTVVVYRVDDLADAMGETERSTMHGYPMHGWQLWQLHDLIERVVAPSWPKDTARPHEFTSIDLWNLQAFVVRGPESTHEQIAGLLGAFRRAVGRAADGDNRRTIYLGCRPEHLAAERAIHRALDDNVTLDLDDAPLADLLAYLRDTAKIETALDDDAVADAKIGLDTPISVRVREMPLRAALNLALDQLDLACTVTEGSLRITHAGRLRPVVKLYAVGDLVACVDPSGEPWDDFRSLIEGLQCDGVGGSHDAGLGVAAGVRIGQSRLLLAIDTEAGHADLAQKLGDLRFGGGGISDGGEAPPRSKRPIPPDAGAMRGMGFM